MDSETDNHAMFKLAIDKICNDDPASVLTNLDRLEIVKYFTQVPGYDTNWETFFKLVFGSTEHFDDSQIFGNPTRSTLVLGLNKCLIQTSFIGDSQKFLKNLTFKIKSADPRINEIFLFFLLEENRSFSDLQYRILTYTNASSNIDIDFTSANTSTNSGFQGHRTNHPALTDILERFQNDPKLSNEKLNVFIKSSQHYADYESLNDPLENKNLTDIRSKVAKYYTESFEELYEMYNNDFYARYFNASLFK